MPFPHKLWYPRKYHQSSCDLISSMFDDPDDNQLIETEVRILSLYWNLNLCNVRNDMKFLYIFSWLFSIFWSADIIIIVKFSLSATQTSSGVFNDVVESSRWQRILLWPVALHTRCCYIFLPSFAFESKCTHIIRNCNICQLILFCWWNFLSRYFDQLTTNSFAILHIQNSNYV